MRRSAYQAKLDVNRRKLSRIILFGWLVPFPCWRAKTRRGSLISSAPTTLPSWDGSLVLSIQQARLPSVVGSLVVWFPDRGAVASGYSGRRVVRRGRGWRFVHRLHDE